MLIITPMMMRNMNEKGRTYRLDSEMSAPPWLLLL
jgi:hypothetical protein